MIRVLYFARFRETLGTASEDIDGVAGDTVAELVVKLVAERGEAWKVLKGGDAHCAVNQEQVDMAHVLADGDELALFPPVTGG